MYYVRKIDTVFPIVVSIFRALYRSIQNMQILQAYIFHILQHFATKLCNFTNFRTLFNAVLMNFTFSIFLQILSIMQSVHCVSFFSPKNGTAALTDFRIECSKWQGGEFPLTYKIQYQSSADEWILWYQGEEQVSPWNKLPAGRNERKYMINITVEIEGKYGGYVKKNYSVKVPTYMHVLHSFHNGVFYIKISYTSILIRPVHMGKRYPGSRLGTFTKPPSAFGYI